MKRPIDYFNHAYNAAPELYNTPTNIYTQPAQKSPNLQYTIDGVIYKNAYVIYPSMFCPQFQRDLDKGLYTEAYLLGDNTTKTFDNIENFVYLNNGVITQSNNNVVFGFEEIANGNALTDYIGKLNRVKIKAKRLKDVIDYSKIESDITTANGNIFSRSSFFELYKDYLVPVTENGNFIYNHTSFFNPLEEPLTRNQIACPVNENGDFLYPINRSNPDSVLFGGYTASSIGDEIAPSKYRTYSGSCFIPFSTINDKNLFPYLKVEGAGYSNDLWGMASIAEGNTGYGILTLNEKGKYVYSVVGRNPEDYGENWKYVMGKSLLDNGLYYEDNLTLFDRCFYFTYEGNVQKYCMFNQKELENYFQAFGVEFEYMFDIGGDFVQGQKVRHASLINKPATNSFTKQRHESLINQQPTSVVKKVRRRAVL